MKENKKYVGTIERKYYIEENYTYAITPLKIKTMARHLGISHYALRNFIISHKLERQDCREKYALQLVKEGYLTNEQICDITRLSKNFINKLRKEYDNE